MPRTRTRHRLTAVAAALTMLAACDGGSRASSTDPSSPGPVLDAPPSTESSPPMTVTCPGQELMGVYHPDRLKVLGVCRWYRGVVVGVKPEEDGDYHIRIQPDTGYEGYLVSGNYVWQEGGIVAEVMPGQQLPLPFEGEHVAVFGTWAYDRQHGWNEIHPIWAIVNLATGEGRFALPPVPPLYDPGG